ncbi:glycosyltransferase family 4 protein [Myroides odoratimimus]|uniref:glycosyltransferase family 4 protein n=2 Tax=Myroides odoratimimus TaxID=76832 RepID=UPI0025778379|nr:glycosyltransferase family 4 protein [Myroides odoratimimus]MDM1506881.1 glycosyltransferase family 4 protein [Myroides odoratimimus]MDM1537767.1 glycosyltransferase family 4 protein [Myroides odoratimimus]MDM1677320.1 glycosyltransferase family 4 protein [Myroides odoratimimus]MDM1680387.1 glycosyltransferase family 4 protein [Myroides odoratimimus]
MKILIAISDSFCANFIKGQGKYLKEKGHDVVIVSGPGIEVDNLEKNEGVKVIRVDFAREISPIRDFRALLKVIKIIRKEKPDIINAGNPKTGFLFSLAHVFFRDIPLIFTLRGVRSDTLVGLKKKIVRFTEYLSCTLSNKVISISPSLKEHAIDINIVKESKCVVLSQGSSNGINVTYYSPNAEIALKSKDFLDEHKLDSSVFKVLFVGRITKDKGIEELLDAFNECILKGAKMKLILAGPIEKSDSLNEIYYEQLEKSEHIIYLGKQLDVRHLYDLADCLVLYSYREGFGNVVIEASSFGVPTVVADIPGLRDTTIDNETGLIVKSKDVESLVEALLKLYSDEMLCDRLGKNGVKRIHTYFKNETVWSAQNDLYKELVNE